MLSIALNPPLSVFKSKPDPSKRTTCWIDNLPMEVISEILLVVINSYGDNIRLKWRFPLLIRRVSGRFYHVTTNTCSLWRYVYIRHPVHPYLRKHIDHSGSLPLVVHVAFHGEPDTEGSDGEDKDGEDDDEGNNHFGEGCEEGHGVEANGEDKKQGGDRQGWVWQELVKPLVPSLSRIASLSLNSPSDNSPIIVLLRYQMPILGSLDVRGESTLMYGHGPSITHFPGLRHLKSHTFFKFDTGFDFPDTLEELYISGELHETWNRAERLWSCLPSTLRILEIERITLSGTEPHGGPTHLPSLTELRLSEYCTWSERSILGLLDAPHLQSLKVVLNYFEPDTATSDLSLDFPALTHIEWESKTNCHLPQLKTLVGRCNNLRYARIKTERCSMSMAEFLMALTDDTAFLPQLEGLGVSGSSLPDVKKMVQARPQLRRLEICEKDMRWKGPTHVKGYGKWEECKHWLESHASVSFWS